MTNVANLWGAEGKKQMDQEKVAYYGTPLSLFSPHTLKTARAQTPHAHTHTGPTSFGATNHPLSKFFLLFRFFVWVPPEVGPPSESINHDLKNCIITGNLP